jgi:hypothetical protein
MTAVCRGGEKSRQSDAVSFRAGVLVTARYAPLLAHNQYLLQLIFCWEFRPLFFPSVVILCATV